MKTIELSKQLKLDRILREARKQDVVLLRRGRAVALVSEMNDEELYWLARERDPKFQASLKRARRQIRNGLGVSHAKLKRRLGLA